MNGTPLCAICNVIRGTSTIHTSIYNILFQAHILGTLSPPPPPPPPAWHTNSSAFMFVVIMLVVVAIKLWIRTSFRIVAVEMKIARYIFQFTHCWRIHYSPGSPRAIISHIAQQRPCEVVTFSFDLLHDLSQTQNKTKMYYPYPSIPIVNYPKIYSYSNVRRW